MNSGRGLVAFSVTLSITTIIYLFLESGAWKHGRVPSSIKAPSPGDRGSFYRGTCEAGKIMACWQCSTSAKVRQKLDNCTRLVYNRVPKCGSRTVLRVFKELARSLNWTLFNVDKLASRRNFYTERQSVVEFLDSFTHLSPPFIYAQHLHFLRFARIKLPTPLYINVIRDPVERLISHFYYKKFGSSTGALWENVTLDYNATLDACVERMRGPCVGINEVLPFFCGHSFSCRRRSAEALELAKKHAAKYFLVIGITEDLDSFFEVLEFLLPRFFFNATNVFRELAAESHARTKTVIKMEPSSETVDKLRIVLKEEYDFYYFVKQNLYKLLGLVRGLKSQEILIGEGLQEFDFG